MTLILKIIVALPLLLMTFVMLQIKDVPQSVEDLKVEQVTYSEAYIKIYGIRTAYKKIEIVSGEKKYSLYPTGSFLPEGMTLDSVLEQLNRSSQATIWSEQDEKSYTIRGIHTQYLNIPPSRGIKHLNDNRNYGRFFSIALLVISILTYLYFKRYYDLDWKLNVKR